MNRRHLLCNAMLCICAILCTHETIAQPNSDKKLVTSVPYKHYDIEDGLVQSQAMAMFQDSWGYLWIATQTGISRFDGREFKNYYNNKELEEVRGATRCILQADDKVYVVYPSGIACFHPDGSLHTYRLPKGYRSTSSNNFVAKGKMYLISVTHTERLDERVIMTWDLADGTFDVIYTYFPEWEIQAILAEGDNEEEWRGFISAPYRVGNYTRQYTFKLAAPGIQLCQEIRLDKEVENTAVFPSRNGEIYIVSKIRNGPNKVYRASFKGDSLQTTYLHSVPGNLSLGLLEMEAGKFLQSAHNPTHIYLIENGERKSLGLPDVIVNEIIRDREGNIWLATEKGIFNLYTLSFTSWIPRMTSSPYVWDFRIDSRGQKWFNCYGDGLWKTDADNRLTPVTIHNNGKTIDTAAGYMNGTTDGCGRIYFNFGTGITVYDPHVATGKQFRFLPVGISMVCWYDSLSGDVFAGTAISEKRAFVRIYPDLTYRTYPSEIGLILSVCRDAKGELRIGTYNTTGRFDKERQMIVRDTASLPYQGIFLMTLDRRGTLWKASQTGLVAEDAAGRDSVLVEGVCSWVLNYNDIYLIAGLNNDMLHIVELEKYYRGEANNMRIFNRHQGINLTEFGQAGVYQDAGGTVWMIGQDNLLSFRPEELMALPRFELPAPAIGGITHRSEKTNWLEENYLRYDLLEATTVYPNDLRFRYRLLPHSSQWAETRNRSIEFQNIPHGTYQLEVQASVDGNFWTESTTSTSTHIPAPFWRSTTGIIILIVAAILFLALFAFLIHASVIRRQRHKQQIDRLRFRAVQSKHIPHFTGNVLSNISFLVNKDTDLARQYIADFSAFSHQTLLNSDRLYRSLEEEIQYAETYLKLEKLRFAERLEYRISIDPDIDTTVTVPLMILQTFCENALKHGLRHKEEGVGRIKIEVYRKERKLILAVEDNGIGRKTAKEKKTTGTGEGLKIVKQQLAIWNKRALLHIKDLYKADNTPAGTRFELHIP